MAAILGLNILLFMQLQKGNSIMGRNIQGTITGEGESI